MPKRPPPPAPDPWPKELAIRRLKEALEKIPELESLNHLDPQFQAWRENLLRILKINWPSERLTHFSGPLRITPFRGGPGPRINREDLDAFRGGLTRTKVQLELILRNEKELAEAEGNQSVTEIFLPPGSQHDAYSYIRQIVSTATREILIVDNYVDSTIFSLLTNAGAHVGISILTYKVPADFKVEAERFYKQHRISLEIRLRKADFHDRFIIVDASMAYHLGASIKDAGDKASMIHLIEDADNVQALLDTHRKSSAAATVL